jgi:hypothetical protein
MICLYAYLYRQEKLFLLDVQYFYVYIMNVSTEDNVSIECISYLLSQGDRIIDKLHDWHMMVAVNITTVPWPAQNVPISIW